MLLLLAVGVVQILYRQGIVLLWVNQRNSPFADEFFRYATHLGDGRWWVLAGLLLLFRSYRNGILMLAIYAVSGILSSILKSLFDVPRPAAYFEKSLIFLHRVSGIDWYYAHSFPSGHTTTAFALFFLLAVWSESHLAKFAWLLPAVVVGYSRMYLLQHFLIDVTFGALLGTVISFLVYWRVEKYWQQNPRRWLNKSILNR